MDYPLWKYRRSVRQRNPGCGKMVIGMRVRRTFRLGLPPCQRSRRHCDNSSQYTLEHRWSGSDGTPCPPQKKRSCTHPIIRQALCNNSSIRGRLLSLIIPLQLAHRPAHPDKLHPNSNHINAPIGSLLVLFLSNSPVSGVCTADAIHVDEY